MLPQASATGNIHIGTIAGKLNGVMPATTPSGWRIIWLSTPVADLLGELALEQLSDAAEANSTTSMPRVHLAQRIVMRLAVLGGDRPLPVGRHGPTGSS